MCSARMASAVDLNNVCLCDVAFADISAIGLRPWKSVSSWVARVAALPGFMPPFELLSMADARLS